MNYPCSFSPQPGERAKRQQHSKAGVSSEGNSELNGHLVQLYQKLKYACPKQTFTHAARRTPSRVRHPQQSPEPSPPAPPQEERVSKAITQSPEGRKKVRRRQLNFGFRDGNFYERLSQFYSKTAEARPATGGQPQKSGTLKAKLFMKPSQQQRGT